MCVWRVCMRPAQLPAIGMVHPRALLAIAGRCAPGQPARTTAGAVRAVSVLVHGVGRRERPLHGPTRGAARLPPVAGDAVSSPGSCRPRNGVTGLPAYRPTSRAGAALAPASTGGSNFSRNVMMRRMKMKDRMAMRSPDLVCSTDMKKVCAD